MTAPLWLALEVLAKATDDSINKLRSQTRDLADKIARDIVRVDKKVSALTEEVKRLKQTSQSAQQAQPEHGMVTYHWEVRDMNDQWQAGGEAMDASSALSRALDAGFAYLPCKYRTWTEATLSSGRVTPPTP